MISAKTIRNGFLLFMVVFLPALSAPVSAAGEKVGIQVAIVQHAPYGFLDYATPVGLHFDLCHEIFKKMGMEPEFVLTDEDKAISRVKDGKAEMAMGISGESARKAKLILCSTPVKKYEMVFFSSADQKLSWLKGFETAKSLKVGIVEGETVPPGLQNAGITPIVVKSHQALYHDLTIGKIQVTPMDRVFGLFDLNRLMLDSVIRPHNWPLESKKYYAAFGPTEKHPDAKALSESFDRIFRVMIDDGSYYQLAKKWLGTNSFALE